MMNSSKTLRLCATIFIALLVYFIPIPAALSLQAWKMFSIFLGTIILIMMGVFPMGASALMGLTVAMAAKTLTFTEAFSGFTSPITWLILIAFFISFGFIHTGLGRRIAYVFIATCGKSSIGLAYSIGLSDLILAPGTPSSTARTGGIIYPVVESIARSFNSLPNHDSRKKIGTYLVLCLFNFSVITSTMFMTAMAANPFVANLASTIGINITWTDWALYALVPGLLSLALVPLILNKIMPPELKDTVSAVAYAKNELKNLGPMKRQESLMALGFIILMTLWVCGPLIGVSAVLAALIGLIFLLVTGVVTWDQLLRLHNAFETFIWFGALLALAEGLSASGFTAWLGEVLASSMTGLPPLLGVVVLFLAYFYSHYFFASCTAHAGAMFLPMLGGALALGAPALPVALVFAYTSALFSSLTHFGSGPAPILFGSGFVSLKEWWWTGFLMSLANIAVWASAGYVWWRILGII